MFIAIHGDKSVDGHFDKFTDEARRILGDLTNLADQVEDIFAGKVLNKSGHMYFVNQSKQRLQRAFPVFEQLIVQIKDKLGIRNEQSSIYRDRRDAEKEDERIRNVVQDILEVIEKDAEAGDSNDESEVENDDFDVISNDDPYTC